MIMAFKSRKSYNKNPPILSHELSTMLTGYRAYLLGDTSSALVMCDSGITDRNLTRGQNVTQPLPSSPRSGKEGLQLSVCNTCATEISTKWRCGYRLREISIHLSLGWFIFSLSLICSLEDGSLRCLVFEKSVRRKPFIPHSSYKQILTSPLQKTLITVLLLASHYF
jgi:hypothetical protein